MCHCDCLATAAVCSILFSSFLKQKDSKAGPHSQLMHVWCHSGGGFPGSYDGTILIAEHGSWARTPAIGYRIVQVRGFVAGDLT